VPTPTPTPAPTPTQPTGPVVSGGGGGSADTTKPTITRLVVPVQVPPARSSRARVSVPVVVTAKDDVAAVQVRVSALDGRWGAWQSIGGAHRVALVAGTGWRGVLVQVRDAAGNRSTPWYQPVLVAPRGSAWKKGTSGADRIRTSRGAQHVDVSSFDRGAVDHVSCGAGIDTVLAQPEDVVARDCEHVVRIKAPAW
jgi:hypothetical protein